MINVQAKSTSIANFIFTLTIVLLTQLLYSIACANGGSDSAQVYLLAPGDEIKINVFQNPDLYLETSITAEGVFNFPLIGQVRAIGKSIPDVERAMENSLRNGSYIRNPSISITLAEIKGNSVIVLGQVTNPGIYPIKNNHVSIAEAIAMAGGVNEMGSDAIRFSGYRNGSYFEEVLDFTLNVPSSPLPRFLKSGDKIYVPRAEIFYIYGQAQKPGAYRVDKGMSVMQAIALSGGITDKGTLRGVTVTRRSIEGAPETKKVDLNSEIKTNDVIFIDESFF